MTTSQWETMCGAAQLNKGLIGLDFSNFPYLSGYGMMIRSLRLNGFGRKDLFAVFGMRAMQNLDLLRACHRLGGPRSRLEVAVGLQDSEIPRFWSEEVWCPIDVGRRWNELRLAPRHCRECLRYGYHCALFQMPFVDRCPWHGVKLHSTCYQCGKLYRGLLPSAGHATRCGCGHDPFDRKTATVDMRSFPAASAAEHLEQYLTWCEGERRRRYLVAPSAVGAWYPALKGLISLPDGKFGNAVRPPDSPNRIYRWDASNCKGDEPKQNAFWPWIVIATSPFLSIAPLPNTLHRPLIKITQAVISHFPPTTSLNLEKDGSRKERRIAVSELIATRPHHFILPFGRTPQEGTWLNLSTVLPESLDLCGCLVDAVDQRITGPTEATPLRSAEAEKSVKFDQLAGRWVLQRALFHILLRGFAIGLTITLRKLSRRQRVCQRISHCVPVAEISCQPGCLQRISVSWVAMAD